MKALKTFAAVVVAGAGLLGASQAGAVATTFTNAGDSANISFTVSAGINATMAISLVSAGGTQAVFSITVSNTSALVGDHVVSFGFENITPDLVVNSATVDSSTSGSWVAETNDMITSQQVELCIWDGQNCNGGANQGVVGGGFVTMQVTMNFVSAVPPITFDGYYMRFAGVTGSFVVPGDGGDGGGTDGGLPEPNTLALLGLGLLGLGFRARRRLM